MSPLSGVRVVLVLVVTSMLGGMLAACAAVPADDGAAALEHQVTDTERAFARTLADRDHAAFTRFLSEETVFFSGPVPLRGKTAVADYWKRFYLGAVAPFAWEPTQVRVLASGTLALSSGPVFNPAGQQVGTFTSVWRLEAGGVWRIVFDKGCSCRDGVPE